MDAGSGSAATAYFYPRPPRGGRLPTASIIWELLNFYPRPPRGGRPYVNGIVTDVQDFYPRPPRGGRLRFLDRQKMQLLISIHALREEGDKLTSELGSWVAEFLSTPSARRATVIPTFNRLERRDFYPRPPRGGRPHPVGQLFRRRISIHALREEGDDEVDGEMLDYFLFLSTPSARRATSYRRGIIEPPRFLSTPSARRATCGLATKWTPLRDFYPRPPRGGRRPESVDGQNCGEISIHALREEGDYYVQQREDTHNGFLSTPSARRATEPGR